MKNAQKKKNFIFLFMCLRLILLCQTKILEERDVVCTSDQMVVNLSFKEPFNGMVYAQNHYQEKECKWPGNGGRYLLIIISLGNGTLEEKEKTIGFCGLTFNRERLEHSITLVIMPEPLVLTGDSFGLVVRCIIDTANQKDIMLTLAAQSIDSIKIMHTETMTVLGNSRSSPQLLLQILEGHGLTGENVTEAYIGQRLTIDAMLQDTSIYDMFVYGCRATDGTTNPEASLSIIDVNGCAIRMARAIDAPVFTSVPVKNAAKHVYVHIYGFQFTSSEFVHFECSVTPCFNSCQRKQCEEPPPTLASVNEIGMSQTTHNSNINLPTYTIKTMLKIVSNKPLAAAQVGNFTNVKNTDGCIEMSWILLIVGFFLLIVFIGLIFCSGKLLAVIFELFDK